MFIFVLCLYTTGHLHNLLRYNPHSVFFKYSSTELKSTVKISGSIRIIPYVTFFINHHV